MAKGKFRSNDYIFHPTTMGAAFSALGVADVPLKRTARMEVNHRDGTINMIRYRPDDARKAA